MRATTDRRHRLVMWTAAAVAAIGTAAPGTRPPAADARRVAGL